MTCRAAFTVAALATTALVLTGCPHPDPPAPSLPAAATQAIDNLKKAASAGDYGAVRALMEPTIVVEASASAIASGDVIGKWQQDSSRLPDIVTAINGGCEQVKSGSVVVVCPGVTAITAADANQDVFVIALREQGDASGPWLLFQALYAD